MSELCSVILLLLLMLFYVCRIYILFSGHCSDYFLKISFVKLLVVSYVSYLYENTFFNVDAAVEVLRESSFNMTREGMTKIEGGGENY